MEELSQSLIGLLAADSFGATLLALGVIYLGGVLSSLTPCIYPMIPITVSVVGGTPNVRDRGERPWHAVALRAFIYVAGLTLVYSTLGVLAGLTGSVFGTMTNTHDWYVILSVVMALAGLVMMDVIPFDPATWWQAFQRRFLGRKPGAAKPIEKEATLLSSFALGMASGLVAAPCTTPILTALLAYIAKTQSVGLGMVYMTSFSLGLSTILLAIAFFTGAVQILPRSGNWMNRVKIGSGMILLAFGLYLMYQAGASGSQ